MESEVHQSLVFPKNKFRRKLPICCIMVIVCVIFLVYVILNGANILRLKATQQDLVKQSKSPSRKWIKIKQENARLLLSIEQTRTHMQAEAKRAESKSTLLKEEEAIRKTYGDAVISEVNAKPYTPNRSKQPLPYNPPSGETPEHRYPQAIIIGFQRCGTRALLDFLSIHPYVKAKIDEVHFFDKDENYNRGYKWYLKQMPTSYSDQVTIERTPSYIYSLRARDEIHRLNPHTKLLVLLRNPVDRMVSEKLARNDTRSVNETTINKIRLSKEYQNSTAISMGLYHIHLAHWFQNYGLHQLHIINGDELVEKPLETMQKVETFLELPALFQSSNFVKHEPSGLYCFRGFKVTSQTICHVKERSWRRPEYIGPQEKFAEQFYKPHNDRLFKLMGTTANWDN